MKKILIALFVFSFALAACLPNPGQATAAPTAQPDTVGTAVAQTMTAMPTSTQIPTQTLVVTMTPSTEATLTVLFTAAANTLSAMSTQTAQPTAVSTLPAGDELMSVCDFTTQSAKNAIGVDVQRIGTEPCGWVWRAVDKATEQAVCPSNMVCTLHLSNDRKVVVKGGSTQYTIVAGTFRIASAYPLDDAVRNPCELLKKEQAFGASEVPSFTVEAGNFSCP